MLERGMEERSPEYPGQAAQLTRYYAVLREAALPEKIIEHEDQPACRSQREYGRESFEHGLSPIWPTDLLPIRVEVAGFVGTDWSIAA
jgi:hypothetical protein